jgi:hypothetical protein
MWPRIDECARHMTIYNSIGVDPTKVRPAPVRVPGSAETICLASLALCQTDDSVLLRAVPVLRDLQDPNASWPPSPETGKRDAGQRHSPSCFDERPI